MTSIPIALGAIPFGSALDETTSFDLLDRFVDAGGSIIDTANNYPFWEEGRTGDESEVTIGRWLASRGNRDRVVISTKCGARPTIAGDRTLRSAEGLSAPVVKAAIDGSLTRLRTDRVDVYWTHIEDRSVPLEETTGALGELVADGRVRSLGASNIATWRLDRARQVAKANGRTPYTHVQLRHTYLRPRPGEPLPEMGHKPVFDDALDYLAHETDLTLWAYNTLMFGAYTRPDKRIPEVYEHRGTTRRLAVLADVARDLGATKNQVVLAWLIAHGVTPIVGVTKREQLDEMLCAAHLELDRSTLDRLDNPV